MAPIASGYNPFYLQGPIQDYELFFNREAYVKKVLRGLRRGQSVSVVGKEKIGKTSLLYYISHPQVAVQHGFESQTGLFFYVDCKRLADLDERDCFRQIKAVIEQTVSAVFPQLYLKKIIKTNKRDESDIDFFINEGINKLRKFQLSSGTFSYWPGRNSPSVWGSTYAGHFLIEAKKLGYNVPNSLLQNCRSSIFR